MVRKINVSGVGCVLVDRLFNNISFNSLGFAKYLSKRNGDGGLVPGQLVFVEEFEQYVEENHDSVLKKIANGRSHDKINVGGPSIVSLVHASQLLHDSDCELRFYGCRGGDEEGEFISDLLKQTKINIDNYIVANGETPSTFVLSDPEYDNARGERIFINSIGTAWECSEAYLNDDFFTSDIVVFGGTALVPQIHDNLTSLLEKVKSKGGITIVNTVYDFRNEKLAPNKKWPLGASDKSYGYIDLLIVDQEEACRLSGTKDTDNAIEFFRKKGTGALIVTTGAEKVKFFSQGSLFEKLHYGELPVSDAVVEELERGKGVDGDTTGCGDNFVGGVLASMVMQLERATRLPDIKEAVSWGVVSGGITTFYMGGVFWENSKGEKRKLVDHYYRLYQKQILV